jgi:hypothetical protein
LARRPKRRSTSRKRPPTPNAARSQVAANAPTPAEAIPEADLDSVPPETPVSLAAGTFLPRRQASPKPAAQPSVAVPGLAAAATASLSASTSFLPKKAGPAGRAERQRQQQAHLEPLDDSPAVPTDRTPYLWLDLRRVMLVSGIMVVMVVVGFFILR